MAKCKRQICLGWRYKMFHLRVEQLAVKDGQPIGGMNSCQTLIEITSTSLILLMRSQIYGNSTFFFHLRKG